VNNFENILENILNEIASNQFLILGILSTLATIIVILIIRFFLVRLVKGKAEILDREQRRWINRINNTASILAFIGFVFIWAPQIQTIALSLTAVAVAVVIVTKELLMCLTGGFLRATTKPFDVGDWITVDSITGEVVRITAFSTLVQEIDDTQKTYEYTGRTIQIPNSKFLTASVHNSHFTKNYLHHNLPITIQFNDLDPEPLMTELEKITEKHFAPYRDESLKFNKRVEKKTGLDFPDSEPRITIKTTDFGHYVFLISFYVPTDKANIISSDITREFLTFAHKIRQENESIQKETIR